MPYDTFLEMAVTTQYDIDWLAARFGVSFEQVCHRMTTLQKEGNKGIRFSFCVLIRREMSPNGSTQQHFRWPNMAAHARSGTCIRRSGHRVIIPQFVELPDGERFSPWQGPLKDRPSIMKPRTGGWCCRSDAVSSTATRSFMPRRMHARISVSLRSASTVISARVKGAHNGRISRCWWNLILTRHAAAVPVMTARGRLLLRKTNKINDRNQLKA